jgi:hypothetical protein
MADIKVLMVLDGERFNFGPKQGDVADANYFGITELIAALETNTTPTIQVDKAHRRGHTFNHQTMTGEDCSVGLSPMYQGDFVFAEPATPSLTIVTADLTQYDVLWLIGDEGLNGGQPGSTADSVITDDEKIAIARFMAQGGGVFAVGDHDGIGSDMCGYLPRVRTMRRWFEYDQTITAGNGQSFVPNWNVNGLDPSTPNQTDRNDTLQPDATDHLFYFNDQSDDIPQNLLDASGTPLVSSAGPIHPLLRDGNGQVIGVFPDHMHEGEATDFASVSATGSPFNPNVSPANPYSLSFTPSSGPSVSFVEFPMPDGFQAEPEVIAYDSDSGHGTYGGSYSGPTPPYAATNPKRRGAISVYDGRASGVGRIVTGSTFHHYLDKNLVGDPQTHTLQTPGHGPTNSELGLHMDALTAIGDFYANVVTWLAKPHNNFQFWVLKNTYGANESVVATAGFPDAFYLVLDGFAPLGNNPTVNFSGPLAGAGVTFTPGTPVPDGTGPPTTPQRILLPFTVNPIPAGAFPPPGGAPKILTLEARLSVGGQNLAAEALFELTASPDPFFANVAATNPPNPFYLSQDLRVFQFAPAIQSAPIIPFQSGWTGHDYITQLLTHLNDPANHYTDGTNDPMPALSEPGDLGVASSVTPTSPGMGGTVPNYAFAVARVRLRNTVAATAPDVRVFFRLFTTLSNDTDYDPVVTYPSSLDAANLPARPATGLMNTTFPMTASPSVASDYPGPNQRNVSVSAGGESYAFFGCYLDVYSPSSPIPAGGHHCLVAQIAFDQAPIVNSNGITLSPENSDKLAQRNIDFTPSGNPGGPAAHRVPQTFDTRPSARTAAPVQIPQGYPDELMIDWGEVPVGSRASIYWPDAAAVDVVRLATLLYPSHNLSVADAHTVQCTVSSRVTYVPIPFAGSGKLGGLFTIDLPLGVRRGQVFSVVVRRIGSRRVPQIPVIAAARLPGNETFNRDWRYVVGTFQITIPVETEDRLIWPEENILAIFKWRLQQLSQSDRWYGVLQRYLEYVTARVEAFGGNPAAIPPSPTGAPAPPPDHDRDDDDERRGCVGILIRLLKRLLR